MKIEVVARIRMDVGRELGILPNGSGRFLKDPVAFAVADDVVVRSCNCLLQCICQHIASSD